MVLISQFISIVFRRRMKIILTKESTSQTRLFVIKIIFAKSANGDDSRMMIQRKKLIK